MASAIGNIEVGVTLAPLNDDQTKRAMALTVAKDALSAGFGKPELDDLLDLTDYILNGDTDPCPLAALSKPMTTAIEFTLGDVSTDAMAAYFGYPAKPAEPDVYTVGDGAGVASLPVGSVLHYPKGDHSYVKVATNDWRRATKGSSDLMLRPRCQDHHMVTAGNPDWPVAAYIPGGV